MEKFDSETNPFSIENMIKKEDTSNDSGYSVSHSEESGSENGLEKPPPPFVAHVPNPTVANPLYQSEMYKNLLIYSNFLSIMQVRISIQVFS